MEKVGRLGGPEGGKQDQPFKPGRRCAEDRNMLPRGPEDAAWAGPSQRHEEKKPQGNVIGAGCRGWSRVEN